MSKPEMIKYTAKNFAKADLATHPDGRIAARVNPESKYPWVLSTRDDDYDWEGDDYLARDGWTPVDLAGLTARAEKAEEVSESWRALCQAATDQRDARDLAAHMWKKVAREHIGRANTALSYASAVQVARAVASVTPCSCSAQRARAEKAEDSLALVQQQRDQATERAEKAEFLAKYRAATVKEQAARIDALRAEQPRPLTADDIEQLVTQNRYRVADAIRSLYPEEPMATDVLAHTVMTALTEPTRPEGAEEIEAYMRELVASHPEDHYGELADHLASRGVLPPLTDKTNPEKEMNR